VVAVNTPGADRACPHGHDGGGPLAAELRALALVALDRLEPLLSRLTAGAADASVPGRSSAAGPCAGCPVCTVLAAVRAERPDLAARLAAHAAELAAALRGALPDGPPVPAAGAAPGPRPARRVERIPVDRPPRTAGGPPC
jgi:hypothetical protein